MAAKTPHAPTAAPTLPTWEQYETATKAIQDADEILHPHLRKLRDMFSEVFGFEGQQEVTFEHIGQLHVFLEFAGMIVGSWQRTLDDLSELTGSLDGIREEHRVAFSPPEWVLERLDTWSETAV